MASTQQPEDLFLRHSTINLTHDQQNDEKSQEDEVQIMQINLARKTVQEMQQCVAEGKGMKLGFGKHIRLRYGSHLKTFRARQLDCREEVYESKGSENTWSLRGILHQVLEIADEAAPSRTETSADSQAALDRLKDQFASLARDREANKTVLVDEVRISGRRNKQVTSLRRREESPVPGRSPVSYSPQYRREAPTSAAQDQGNSIAKSRAQKFAMLHLLAMRPISEDEVCKVTSIPATDCRSLLEKYGDENAGKKEWQLGNRWYKDLDVWRFPYKAPEDRQAAIDNAVKAFDRQRLNPTDSIWQSLLPLERRGKGKSLSKLKLHSGTQAPTSGATPKIPSNHRKQLGAALSGAAAGGASPKRGSKASKELSQAKPSGDEKAKSNAGDSDRSPKPNPRPASVKQAQKKDQERTKTSRPNGKAKPKPQPLSSEFVHSSDEEEVLRELNAKNATQTPERRSPAARNVVDDGRHRKETPDDHDVRSEGLKVEGKNNKRRLDSPGPTEGEKKRQKIEADSKAEEKSKHKPSQPKDKPTDVPSSKLIAATASKAERSVKEKDAASVSKPGEKSLSSSQKSSSSSSAAVALARPEKQGSDTRPREEKAEPTTTTNIATKPVSQSKKAQSARTTGGATLPETRPAAPTSGRSASLSSSAPAAAPVSKPSKAAASPSKRPREETKQPIPVANAKRQRVDSTSDSSSYLTSPASTASAVSQAQSRSSQATTLTSPATLTESERRAMLSDPERILRDTRKSPVSSLSSVKGITADKTKERRESGQKSNNIVARSSNDPGRAPNESKSFSKPTVTAVPAPAQGASRSGAISAKPSATAKEKQGEVEPSSPTKKRKINPETESKKSTSVSSEPSEGDKVDLRKYQPSDTVELVHRTNEAYVCYLKARQSYDETDEVNPETVKRMWEHFDRYEFLRREEMRRHGMDEDRIFLNECMENNHHEGSSDYYEQKIRDLWPKYEEMSEQFKTAKASKPNDFQTVDLSEKLQELENNLKALRELRLTALEQEEDLRKPASVPDTTLNSDGRSSVSAEKLTRRQALSQYANFYKYLHEYEDQQRNLRQRPGYPDVMSGRDMDRIRQMRKRLAEMRAEILQGLVQAMRSFSETRRGAVSLGDRPTLTQPEADAVKKTLETKFLAWRQRHNNAVTQDFGRVEPREMERLWSDLDAIDKDYLDMMRAYALDFGKKQTGKLEDVSTVRIGGVGDVQTHS